ncbi:transcriptional regulator NrdR [Rubidibacter lacunae KORDI 51-2]|uniref:Transcriptional repressor NrdR n=1 Tax=Rubidibacter lacunae KORDI 51-2 TaxID=582515 RepID=U5D6R5_9CHRO|nr:transcriptional regulator NrdR [Rubidibacter lacunae]ERN40353.1 transcriptional regulator NrdR [Rubidibacter lacunae KORDI 51-2]
MQCPRCQHTSTRVLESRVPKDGKSVRRRRECIRCSFRFTTYEKVEETPLLVVKRDGTHEPFDRERLLTDINRACEGIDAMQGRTKGIVDEIERQLQRRADGEISQSDLADLALSALRRHSEIAYLRFAIAYHRYQSLQEVEELIAALNALRVHPPREGDASLAVSS